MNKFAWERLQKPPIGTPIDRRSPLARGLVWFAPMWESGGTTIADIAGGQNLGIEGGAAWVPGGSPAVGAGLACTASGTGAHVDLIPTRLQLSEPLSLVIGLRWNGTLPTANAALFGLSGSNTGGANGAIRFQFVSATPAVIIRYNGGSSSPTLATLSAGVDSVLIVTVKSNLALTAYLNGVQTATAAGVGGAGYTATSQISFGQVNGSAASTINCTVYFAAIYNRALSAGEVATWSGDPCSIFADPLSPAVVSQGSLPSPVTFPVPRTVSRPVPFRRGKAALGGHFALPGPTVQPVTNCYVDKSGSLVYLFGVYGGVLQNVTAVASNPSFFLNGSTSPLGNVQGPFWSNTGHLLPWVCYQLPTPVASTDTLTFSAAASWMSSGSNHAPAAVTQVMANYTAQDEAGVGHWSGMGPGGNQILAAPGFGTKYGPRKLGLGYVAGWGTLQETGTYYNFCKNWVHAALWYKSQGVATTDANGHPLTINGTGGTVTVPLVAVSTWNPQINPVDSRGTPTILGTYTFIADETAPSTPMTAAWTIANGTITASGTTAGILTGGVQVGKTWWATIGYSATPPTNLNIILNLVITSAGAANPGPYTLSNEAFFEPADTVDRSDPYAAGSRSLARTKNAASMRWMDCTLGFDGFSSIVDDTDLRDATNFSWNLAQKGGAGSAALGTGAVTAIRFYDITVNPNVYVNQQFANTTATPGGTPAPYYWTPATVGQGNNGFMNWTGLSSANGWWCGECVHDGSVLFKTGQLVSFGTGLSGITITNGAGTCTANLNNQANIPIWVTSATTFAFTTFLGTGAGQITTGNTANTHPYGQVVGSTAVTSTVKVQVPDQGAIPYEVIAHMTGQIPGADLLVNIPIAATDACVTRIAQRVRDNFPAGRHVRPEYSNEVWSGVVTRIIAFSLGQLEAFGATWGANNAYVARAAQIHQIFRTVFGPRAGEIVGYYGGWIGNMAQTITAANTVNAASPTVPVQVEEIGGAYYWDVLTDSTLVSALASLYATQSNSNQFGNAYPFSRAMCCNLLKHMIKYSSSSGGGTSTGPAGSPGSNVGSIQLDLTAIQSYVPAGTQAAGFKPLMVGYESGIERVVNTISTGTPNLANIAAHDLTYDPAFYDVETALYEVLDYGGVKFVHLYNLLMNRYTTSGLTTDTFGLYTWPGQSAGRGDGSDGLVVNTFYNFATNQGADAANVSVRGQAWLDWAATGSPTTDPVVVRRRWFAGLRRSIVG